MCARACVYYARDDNENTDDEQEIRFTGFWPYFGNREVRKTRYRERNETFVRAAGKTTRSTRGILNVEFPLPAGTWFRIARVFPSSRVNEMSAFFTRA